MAGYSSRILCGFVAVMVVAACGDEQPSGTATSRDAQPETQSEADGSPRSTDVQVDIAQAASLNRPWSATVDGFSLRVSWVDIDLLGQTGDRVARPGLYFASLGVEVTNPLDDRASPGVADETSLQVAIAEGPHGCPEGGTSSRIGDGSHWCLLPSTVEPGLSGDFVAGESRTVQVIAEEPLEGVDIVADRLAIAAAAEDETVLLAIAEPSPFDAPAPPPDGGERIRGRLSIEGEPVEGIRVLVVDTERRLAGEAASDAGGEWEVATGGPGEFLVMLDQRTLPDGVGLRDPGRWSLQIMVSEGATGTALFALG